VPFVPPVVAAVPAVLDEVPASVDEVPAVVDEVPPEVEEVPAPVAVVPALLVPPVPPKVSEGLDEQAPAAAAISGAASTTVLREMRVIEKPLFYAAQAARRAGAQEPHLSGKDRDSLGVSGHWRAVRGSPSGRRSLGAIPSSSCNLL